MSRLTKQMVLQMLREASCIQTPTLNHFFNTVWVGEEMKQRIESAKQKMKY